MKKQMEIHACSMILGFPRFPLHRRNQQTMQENYAFAMILGFHASHLAKEIVKM